MEKQIKSGVKEIYTSVRAPEALKEKTLQAVAADRQKPRASYFMNNIKRYGLIAACLLLCVGFGVTAAFSNRNINISASDTGNIRYLPEAVAQAAKQAEHLYGNAVKIDVDFRGKFTVTADGGQLALQNGDNICAVPSGTEIDGSSTLYIITDGEDKITVTFTDGKQVKTLALSENPDGSYSVVIE